MRRQRNGPGYAPTGTPGAGAGMSRTDGVRNGSQNSERRGGKQDGQQQQQKPPKPRKPVNPRGLTHYSYLLGNDDIRMHYTRNEQEADMLVSGMTGPLGFDIEWKPNYAKGGQENPVALVQIADERLVLLVQISAMSQRFPAKLKQIIEDPSVVKAGVGIEGDAQKLWKDCGVSARNCVELSALAYAVDPQWLIPRPVPTPVPERSVVSQDANSSGGDNDSPKPPPKPFVPKPRFFDDPTQKHPGHLISLGRLIEAYEHCYLHKPNNLRASNWENSLNARQQEYAATDAYAGLAIYKRLMRLAMQKNPIPLQRLYTFDLVQGSTALHSPVSALDDTVNALRAMAINPSSAKTTTVDTDSDELSLPDTPVSDARIYEKGYSPFVVPPSVNDQAKGLTKSHALQVHASTGSYGGSSTQPPPVAPAMSGSSPALHGRQRPGKRERQQARVEEPTTLSSSGYPKADTVQNLQFSNTSGPWGWRQRRRSDDAGHGSPSFHIPSTQTPRHPRGAPSSPPPTASGNAWGSQSHSGEPLGRNVTPKKPKSRRPKNAGPKPGTVVTVGTS